MSTQSSIKRGSTLPTAAVVGSVELTNALVVGQSHGWEAKEPLRAVKEHYRSRSPDLFASVVLRFSRRLPTLPRCAQGCLAHPSNTALGYLPELLSPAPLRCGVVKGSPNSVVNVLHAHKKHRAKK